jgi:hypothetical protein
MNELKRIRILILKSLIVASLPLTYNFFFKALVGAPIRF